MKLKTKITVLAFSTFLLSVTGISAQDAHWSQYTELPVLINPSLTGTQNQNNIRAGAQLRSQWGALTSNINSAAFAVDAPLKGRWGIGGYMLNNLQSKYFNVFNFVLSTAYTVSSTDQNIHFLSVGLQAGVILKSIKDNNLVFDSQYVNGNFDPDLPSGESFVHSSKLMPELNYGIYYGYTDPSKKYHPYLGFSLFHITSPNESFTIGAESRLPRKWVLHGGCPFTVTDAFMVEPKILFMKQSNIQEIIAGMDFDYTFKNPEIKVLAGCSYRLNDAAIVQAGISFRNLIYKMSYDINTSSLNTYTNKRGGLEFTIVSNGLIGNKTDKKN